MWTFSWSLTIQSLKYFATFREDEASALEILVRSEGYDFENGYIFQYLEVQQALLKLVIIRSRMILVYIILKHGKQ